MNITLKYQPVTYKAGWDCNGVWALHVNLSDNSFMFLFYTKPTARQIRRTVKRAKRKVWRYDSL